MLHYRPPMILVSKLRVSHEEIDFLSTSEVLLIWTFSLVYPFYMYSSWLLVYFPSEVFPFLATHPNIELAYLCISCPRDFVAGWKAEPACKTSWFFCFQKLKPQGEGMKECLTEISRVAWHIYTREEFSPDQKKFPKLLNEKGEKSSRHFFWFPRVAPRGCG